MAGNGRQKRDDVLLLALATGKSTREAGEKAGISERTIYRRLEDPDFQRRLNATRAEMIGRALGMLADGSTEAVTTLRGLLTAESESVRLGAARSILELGNRLREAVEMEQRISELERRADAKNSNATAYAGTSIR